MLILNLLLLSVKARGEAMASLKQPDNFLERFFNIVLVASLLLHSLLWLLVMNVEPPPPPNQEEYATWLKKVTPPKIIEEKELESEPKIEPEVEKKEQKEEVAKAPVKRAIKKKTKAPPAAEKAKREEVRKKLSGAGILATIGSASEEKGGLANVFESGSAVGSDLQEALSERGNVRVTGGSRIGKKGAVGSAADIGNIDAGAGGSAGSIGERKDIAPKAFVKSGKEIIPSGKIDEKGVRMALKRRERGIQQCYERALKASPKLKGAISLRWGIDSAGRVRSIKITKNTLGSSSVADCIGDIIKRIRFPKASKGVVIVSKTFVFESG